MSQFMLAGLTESSLHGHVPESVFVMYQLTFAAITPALVVGGFAERMKFSAILLLSSLWLVLVYAPICHWVWSDEGRSEAHTSELQSLMRISYAVFCLKNKRINTKHDSQQNTTLK